MSSYYNRPLRSDELYHHGVLGMKWGHRKARPSYSSLSPKQKKRLDRKAERIVARNNRLSRRIAKNNIAFRKNKYNAAGHVVNGLVVGAAGVAFAPTPGLKAAAAAYGTASLASVITAGGNKANKRKLDKGQQWLKDNGYTTKSTETVVNARKAGAFTNLGYEKVKQFELEKRGK